MTDIALAAFVAYVALLIVGLLVARRLNNVSHRRLPPKQTLVVWLVLGGLAWLDHGRSAHVHTASAFAWVGTVISVIGDFLGVVGAAVDTALTAVVAALASSVTWIVKTFGTFMSATGSVFSKVWDGLKVVWNDVLKPVLSWVDEELGKLKGWLKNTFGPVFDWLRSVRDTLTNVYKRFLKPILNFIDLVHGLDQLLQVFHIRVLAGLDATLEALEQRLEEPLLWLNGKINQILGVLTTIITADGFFQKETLLKSLARDVGSQWRILMNSTVKPSSAGSSYRITRALETPSIDTAANAAASWLNGDASDDGQSLDAAVQAFGDVVNADMSAVVT